MEVTLGYSREHPGGTRWSKMDVLMQEVDLKRLFAERGLPPDTAIRPHQAFLLLHCEGQAFLIAQQLNDSLITSEDAAKSLANIRATRDKIISEIKESLQ